MSALRSASGVAAGGFVVGLVVALLAGPAPAGPGGRTVYVSPSGTDSGNGTAAHPWRSIATATARAGPQALILVSAGSYQPFTINDPGQVVRARPGQRVVVHGRSGVQDVVRISADDAVLVGLTVTGCVPVSDPPGGLDADGSSDVRIDDGTSGVTLRKMTITDSRGTNSSGRSFGCYGVFAHHAADFHVTGSDISGTGAGIFVNGDAQGSTIAGNQIHDNDVLIRDTPGAAGSDSAADDYGASGVLLTNVNATPGVVVAHNTIVGNRGPSADYGTDGSAVEYYNASNTVVRGNTISDNNVVLETGASPGGACNANVFQDNQVSGSSSGVRSAGPILRCATAMRLTGNVFTDVTSWVFDIDTRGSFATDVDGLTITGNTVSQQDSVYILAVDPGPAGLRVDRNRYLRTGPTFAQYLPPYADYDTSDTLQGWQQRTGLDAHSTTG